MRSTQVQKDHGVQLHSPRIHLLSKTSGPPDQIDFNTVDHKVRRFHLSTKSNLMQHNNEQIFRIQFFCPFSKFQRHRVFHPAKTNPESIRIQRHGPSKLLADNEETNRCKFKQNSNLHNFEFKITQKYAINTNAIKF